MSTKSDVLYLLEKQRMRYVSGQEIADILKLSRTSVWKAIKSLEEDGYVINAVRNLGYRLKGDADLLSIDGVLSFLDKEKQPPQIKVLKTVDSTNKYAKKLALSSAAHGLLVLAEEQTSGRGRNGKDFFSPYKTGLYMSILLRPDDVGVHLLTLAAGIAVCEAIEELTGQTPRIKWVNDVYLNGKKICGILSEAGIDLESGGIDYVVVGIGINCTTSDENFPSELCGKAGSIETSISRCELAALIYGKIMVLSQLREKKNLINSYRELSLMHGKQISFIFDGKNMNGCAMGINDDGSLKVKLEDGTDIFLIGGEISICGDFH